MTYSDLVKYFRVKSIPLGCYHSYPLPQVEAQLYTLLLAGGGVLSGRSGWEDAPGTAGAAEPPVTRGTNVAGDCESERILLVCMN